MVGVLYELPAEKKENTSIPTRELVAEQSEIHCEGNAACVAGGCHLGPSLKEMAQESHVLLWPFYQNSLKCLTTFTRFQLQRGCEM